MTGLTDDLRYALRTIRRAPLFSAVAVGCLTVGISVNVAAFSVLNAFLVRDLPGVTDQSALTAILVSNDTRFGRSGPSHLSPPDWEAFRRGIPAFESISVFGSASVALRVAGEPTAVRADFVSGDFFTTLGTRPAAGRLLTPDDDRAGAHPTVVISHRLWESDFDARPDIAGRTLYVGKVAFSIAGVAPPGFSGVYPGELVADPEHGAPFVFIPLAAASLVRGESRHATPAAALDDRWLRMIGRRRAGVALAEVEAQANVVAAGLATAYPRERGAAQAVARHPTTASTAEMIAGFGFTMAIPMLILLVACANLANQLLARAVQRSREIGVRLSLGATRARIVRLLLVESTTLAVAASIIAAFLARALIDIVGTRVLIMPFRIPMDARVLLFTIGLAFVTALAFGLVPALRATRLDLTQAMKDGANAGGYTRSRLRSALVVVQVAASVALLAVAGVFMRASDRSEATHIDDAAQRMLTVSVDLSLLDYSPAAGSAFHALAMERLRGLPGVQAVALAPIGPTGSTPERRVSVDGDAPERERYLEVAEVAGDWFAAQMLRPIAGRVFDPEASNGEMIAVINDAVAQRLWPGASALGRTLRIGEGANTRTFTVIGVVPARRRDPRDNEPRAIITIPASATSWDPAARLHVLARGNAADLSPSVRAVVRELDPRLPPPTVTTVAEAVAETVAPVAQIASGVGAMGTIALLLAALGLSAVLAFIVEQRRHEIGVRIALGAPSGAVVGMVLRQALVLAAVGISAGAVIAVATTTLLRNLLFGLPPVDPIAFGGSAAVIIVVALLATLAPATRAARVDPMVALRAD